MKCIIKESKDKVLQNVVNILFSDGRYCESGLILKQTSKIDFIVIVWHHALQGHSGNSLQSKQTIFQNTFWMVNYCKITLFSWSSNFLRMRKEHLFAFCSARVTVLCGFSPVCEGFNFVRLLSLRKQRKADNHTNCD